MPRQSSEEVYNLKPLDHFITSKKGYSIAYDNLSKKIGKIGKNGDGIFCALIFKNPKNMENHVLGFFYEKYCVSHIPWHS